MGWALTSVTSTINTPGAAGWDPDNPEKIGSNLLYIRPGAAMVVTPVPDELRRDQGWGRRRFGREVFDAGSLSRQQFVRQGEEMVLHGAAIARGQVETPCRCRHLSALAVMGPNGWRSPYSPCDLQGPGGSWAGEPEAQEPAHGGAAPLSGSCNPSFYLIRG